MTRPGDLLGADTSARLHARAVAVMERLRGHELRVIREVREHGCATFDTCCEVDVSPDGRLTCRGCGAPPRDLVDLVRAGRRAGGRLSFDAACAQLESIADTIDREAARAAGQGELF